MVVNTPSKYIIEIKDFVSFGLERALQRIYAKGSQITTNNSGDPKNPKTLVNFSGEIVLDAEDYALEHLVIKITKGDKVITSGFLEEVNSWERQDASIVYDAINKMTNPDVL